MTKSAVNAGRNTAYDGNINSDDGKYVLNNLINTAVNKGSSIKKGSAVAKSHMAKIRHMQKSKKSENILDDITCAISSGSVRDNVPTFRRPIKGSREEKKI